MMNSEVMVTYSVSDSDKGSHSLTLTAPLGDEQPSSIAGRMCCGGYSFDLEIDYREDKSPEIILKGTDPEHRAAVGRHRSQIQRYALRFRQTWGDENK